MLAIRVCSNCNCNCSKKDVDELIQVYLICLIRVVLY